MLYNCAINYFINVIINQYYSRKAWVRFAELKTHAFFFFLFVIEELHWQTKDLNKLDKQSITVPCLKEQVLIVLWQRIHDWRSFLFNTECLKQRLSEKQHFTRRFYVMYMFSKLNFSLFRQPWPCPRGFVKRTICHAKKRG